MVDSRKITPRMTVREIITKYPSSVNVFIRHGLESCGGPPGPVEPVAFFATVHQLDPARLVEELNDAVNAGDAEPAPKIVVKKPAPDIYRRFVKAAIIIALTLGCTLGAFSLAAMALGGTMGTVWASYLKTVSPNGSLGNTWLAVTQAHGHAQIFGWVGLFIMGVAYHVLPRLKVTELKNRPLAEASFWLVLAGVVLRFAAQPMSSLASFGVLVVLASVLELVGVSFYLYVAAATMVAGAQARDFYDKYIAASAVWFWIVAAATLALSIYSAATGIETIPDSINGPYLHIGLMGFIVMMIFGFSLRTVPLFLGLHPPNKRAFDVIFWTLNVAIAVRALGMFASGNLNDPLAPSVTLVASVVEYASVMAFVYFLNIFRTPEVDISASGADRGHEKYVRAAYLWLVVAASMTIGYSIYQGIVGTEVAHAYISAYRHALTVGFISMMLMGMSSRIIPVFTGAKLYSSSLLLATFVLVNLGNIMRVASQPLAGEFGGPFVTAMGVSGFVEVLALLLFAYNIWKTMDNKEDEVDETEDSEQEQDSAQEMEDSEMVADNGAVSPTELPITKDHIVGEVLERYPSALDAFVRNGFENLRDESLRKTVAKTVNIEFVSRMHSVDLEKLLAEVNEACESEEKSRRGLVA